MIIDGRKKKRPGIDEQRKAIMSAATPLLLEKGMANVNVSQICKAADVSRPTYYRCFEDKDELMCALYESSVNEAVSSLMLEELASAGQTITKEMGTSGRRTNHLGNALRR